MRKILIFFFVSVLIVSTIVAGVSLYKKQKNTLSIPLSKESNLGLSYTYVPYQDGAGDLVIKKDKRLVTGKLVQNQHNQYSLSF